MKKLIFTAAILISCLSFNSANAQIRVSLGVNIGVQPDWGPVGYDHADYYYMPDIGAYYDVPSHQYVYLSNNVWIRRPYLPVRYRNYDLYNGYKVVINRPEPWRYDRDYRTRYAGYRGRGGQVIIRDSRDVRYRNHWRGDNGFHGGRYGDRGRGGQSRDMGHRGGDRGRGGEDRGHGGGGDHGRGGDRGHGGGDRGRGHDH